MGPINKRRQPVRVEPDSGSGYTFELVHVYAPGAADDRRGPVSVLAPLESHWEVVESATSDRRSLTYGDALERHGAKFTFARFSTLNHMREELRALFAK